MNCFMNLLVTLCPSRAGLQLGLCKLARYANSLFRAVPPCPWIPCPRAIAFVGAFRRSFGQAAERGQSQPRAMSTLSQVVARGPITACAHTALQTDRFTHKLLPLSPIPFYRQGIDSIHLKFFIGHRLTHPVIKKWF